MTEREGHLNEVPLESWKEIAAYLKRDVRTVKRWEKGEGLPVRRHQHQARSSVYAYPSEVLPRAAAFVHHGGIETTAQALAAGVRQLVVPLAHDQPDNAVRVRRLGVGDFLLPKAYKASAVVKRLDSLRGSAEVAAACRQRAGEVAAGTGLEQACDLIEELGARQQV